MERTGGVGRNKRREQETLDGGCEVVKLIVNDFSQWLKKIH